MKKFQKISKILSVLIAITFVASCQVTMEQGKELESAGKMSDATRVYWQIIKGDEYLGDLKQQAYEAIVRIKDPVIVPEFAEMLNNKGELQRRYTAKLILNYSVKNLYKNLGQSLFYASETEANIANLKNILVTFNEQESIDQIVAVQEIFVSGNSKALSAYYEVLARYNNKAATDKLLDTLVSQDANCSPILLNSFKYSRDVRIIEPLLKISKKLSEPNKMIIADVFLNFDNANTYTYLIKIAAYHPEYKDKIFKFLKGKLTVTNTTMLEDLLALAKYDLNDPLVPLVVELLNEYSDVRAVDNLVNLLDLKQYTQSEEIDKKIDYVCRTIEKLGDGSKLYKIFTLLNDNIQLPKDNDYYAYSRLYDVAVKLQKKAKISDENVIGFLNSMKELTHVYKMQFIVNKIKKEADELNDVTSLRESIRKIADISIAMQSYLPITTIYSHVNYYIDGIDDANRKKEASYLVRLSGYMEVLKMQSIKKVLKDYVVVDVDDLKTEPANFNKEQSVKTDKDDQSKIESKDELDKSSKVMEEEVKESSVTKNKADEEIKVKTESVAIKKEVVSTSDKPVVRQEVVTSNK